MTEAWKTWEGQTVDGFPLRKYLGGSDHSAVYLTQLSASSQDAAIKFVPADSDAETHTARWRAAGQLSHPHLQQLIRVGRCQIENSDFLYVVMEHAEEDLSQILPQRALEPDEVRPVLEEVVGALTYLHGQGLAHTMLKPGNILAAGDKVKISSDSIAEIGSRRPQQSSSIYLAPESSSSPLAASADVWSLGVTLVEMLTQRTPSVRQSHVDLPEQGMPAPFLEIARRSLELDPTRRITLPQIAYLLNPSTAVAVPVAVSATAAPASTSFTASANATDAFASSETSPAANTAPPPSTRNVASFSGTLGLSSLASSAPSVATPVEAKKSLASQQATLVPRNLTSGTTASAASIPVVPSRRSSRFAIPAVAALLVVGAILLAPRMMNRFSQLQPAPVTEPSTVPAPSNLQSETVTTRQENFKSANNDSQPIDPSRNSAGEKNRAAKKSPALVETAANSAAGSNRRDVSASTREVAPREAAPSPAKSAKNDIAAGSSKGSVLFQVVPDISQRARDTIQGRVRVSVRLHVDPSGTVVGKTIENDGSSKFFAEQAIKVADRWTFNPPEKDGRAVPSEWLLRFEFSPHDTKVFPAQTNP
jgi:TonB family protein